MSAVVQSPLDDFFSPFQSRQQFFFATMAMYLKENVNFRLHPSDHYFEFSSKLKYVRYTMCERKSVRMCVHERVCVVCVRVCVLCVCVCVREREREGEGIEINTGRERERRNKENEDRANEEEMERRPGGKSTHDFLVLMYSLTIL